MTLRYFDKHFCYQEIEVGKLPKIFTRCTKRDI